MMKEMTIKASGTARKVTVPTHAGIPSEGICVCKSALMEGGRGFHATEATAVKRITWVMHADVAHTSAGDPLCVRRSSGAGGLKLSTGGQLRQQAIHRQFTVTTFWIKKCLCHCGRTSFGFSDLFKM